jgi:uncharacterized protein (TIGR04255 family)
MGKYDDLILERVVIEARFERGYLYLDNCGKIWLSISEKWPKLVETEITPNGASFNLGGSDTKLVFDHRRIAIEDNFPDKLDQFIKFSDDSFQIIEDYLNIKSFSRIGLRFIYAVEEDIESVTKLLLDKQLLVIPEQVKPIGKKVTPSLTKFEIERDDISITVQTGFGKRTIQISVPKPFKVNINKLERKGLFVDLDFFCQKIVELGTFDVKDFIEVQQKNARKLIDTLFA